MSKEGKAISFAGNLTEDPEVRYTEAGIARATFLVAVSGRREQEAAFFTVIVWRPSRARRAVAGQGQPGRGHGPAPAADLDG
jgi:single-stranded DNA-binding protein